jgi:hypothetical protein
VLRFTVSDLLTWSRLLCANVGIFLPGPDPRSCGQGVTRASCSVFVPQSSVVGFSVCAQFDFLLPPCCFGHRGLAAELPGFLPSRTESLPSWFPRCRAPISRFGLFLARCAKRCELPISFSPHSPAGCDRPIFNFVRAVICIIADESCYCS